MERKSLKQNHGEDPGLCGTRAKSHVFLLSQSWRERRKQEGKIKKRTPNKKNPKQYALKDTIIKLPMTKTKS